MQPINKEDYDYNLMAQETFKNEMFLIEKAQEYGLFCIICDRENKKIITFEDYLNKLCIKQ